MFDFAVGDIENDVVDGGGEEGGSQQQCRQLRHPLDYIDHRCQILNEEEGLGEHVVEVPQVGRRLHDVLVLPKHRSLLFHLASLQSPPQVLRAEVVSKVALVIESHRVRLLPNDLVLQFLVDESYSHLRVSLQLYNLLFTLPLPFHKDVGGAF